MDNEKFQDLMMDQFAKLFNEVQRVNTELQDFKREVRTEFSEVKSEIATVKESQIRMETEFGNKLDVLYIDWRETQKQFNEEVKTELQILDTKVEALQMESTKHDQEIKALYLVKPKE